MIKSLMITIISLIVFGLGAFSLGRQSLQAEKKEEVNLQQEYRAAVANGLASYQKEAGSYVVRFANQAAPKPQSQSQKTLVTVLMWSFGALSLIFLAMAPYKAARGGTGYSEFGICILTGIGCLLCHFANNVDNLPVDMNDPVQVERAAVASGKAKYLKSANNHYELSWLDAAPLSK